MIVLFNLHWGDIKDLGENSQGATLQEATLLGASWLAGELTSIHLNMEVYHHDL